MSELKKGSIAAVRELAEALKGARRAVAFTGAGISVPSGIPDFRSATGLYSTKFGDFDPETILSHDFFKADPEDFFKFYREKMLYADAKPNSAHRLLAELEKRGILSAVITQNIDGLHHDAGSKRVLELHGTVRKNHCERCGRAYFGTDEIVKARGVPRCDCGGVIKPDVVLYGEALDNDVFNSAARFVERADVMLIIGTSLKVYPAAGLVYSFCGDALAVINKGEASTEARTDIIIDDDCSAVADELFKLLK